MKLLRLGRPRVFVAYGSDAKDFARELAARLDIAGVEPFLDERELVAGSAYDPTLKQAVSSSDLFLFVITTRSVESGAYALTELEWAISAKRPLMGVHPYNFDDVVPPPEIVAGVCIRSRGDRVARTVSEVKERVAAPIRRTRRAAYLLAIVPIVAVIIGYLLFSPEDFGGSIYDRQGRPIEGVSVAFVGMGPERLCPPVITDKQGGFVFDKCTTARRSENPRVRLQPPNREPCQVEVALMTPPRMTVVRIDPSEPSCLPQSDPGVPVPPPDACAESLKNEIERTASSHGLDVRTVRRDVSGFELLIAPRNGANMTVSLAADVQTYRAGCLLFNEVYDDNQKMLAVLERYITDIRMDATLVRVDEMLRLGFTRYDVGHLREHLQRFRSLEQGRAGQPPWSIHVLYSSGAELRSATDGSVRSADDGETQVRVLQLVRAAKAKVPACKGK